MIDITGINDYFDMMNDNQRERTNMLIKSYNEILTDIENKKIFNKYSVRYQDYYDMNVDGNTNLSFFIDNCPKADVENQVLFCKYILEKELEDFIFVVCNPELGIDELINIIEKKDVINNIEYLFEKINILISSIENKNEISNSVNIIITHDNIDYIKEMLTKNKTGASDISIAKGLSALRTMSEISYNSVELSNKIHKVVDNSRNHDIRLTDHKILLERYSTSCSTKVIFFKLPIALENVEIIFNNPSFESMYYVVGFGDFSYSGYNEYDFYRHFIKEAYSKENQIQTIVDLVSKPFVYEENGVKYDRRDEFIKLVEKSADNINNINSNTSIDKTITL